MFNTVQVRPLAGTADAVGVVNGRPAVATGDTTDLLDPTTSRILGRIPISGDADFVGPVTDGVITINRGYSADLYAERPDIRSTRRLPS